MGEGWGRGGGVVGEWWGRGGGVVGGGVGEGGIWQGRMGRWKSIGDPTHRRDSAQSRMTWARK